MAATAKKLQVVRPRTLADLIDEAGELNEEIRQKKKQYDALREVIAGQMVAGTKEEGGEFQAEFDYKSERIIAPQDLMVAVDSETFHGLVRVQVGLAEKMLDKDLFREIHTVITKDEPTLTITRKHEKDA